MLIFKEDIRLPRILMGKLDPEDWRGLIASALYYYNNYQRVSMVSLLTMILPFAIGFVLVLVLGFRLFEAQSELRLFLPLVIAVYGAIQLLALRHYFRSFSGLWYRADKLSAEIVGKDSLLKALEKAKTVGEASGIRQPRLATWASLENRISHLNTPKNSPR
jgi:Zn-dependent protease with chaperone function